MSWNEHVRSTPSCILVLALLCACASCGGPPGPSGPGSPFPDGEAQSLLLIGVTDDCVLGDSSTLFQQDGRFERTSRTPAGDGTYLGHISDGRIDAAAARRIFSGVEEAARTNPLMPWDPTVRPLAAHLCGRNVLVVSDPNGTAWVLANADGAAAFDPWIEQLGQALRPPPEPR
jgi:hypothetical protein